MPTAPDVVLPLLVADEPEVPAVAEPLVVAFTDALRALGAEVCTGAFGADMQVRLVNDGPVTLLLEM